MRLRAIVVPAILLLLVSTLTSSEGQAQGGKRKQAAIIGRWDITVKSPDGSYPSWLEVKRSGSQTLVGTFVGRSGSARPIGEVHFKDGQLRFAVPVQWERRTTPIMLEGRLENDTLEGVTIDDAGREASWTGRRAPSLFRTTEPAWSEPIELFNGKNLDGWKPRNAKAKNGWEARDGILVNARPGNDLLTDRGFGDFKLHLEFRYPARSNSGIYLRGRYELQIEDNFGEEPECHRMGSVYGFLTPSVNAARKAGEWQSMDLTLTGRVLSVALNGERIIDRQAIPGITGGALDSNEGEPGPILLQGDHGQIEFRKLTLTPAKP